MMYNRQNELYTYCLNDVNIMWGLYELQFEEKMIVVYNAGLDLLGVLEGNLVRIDESNLFIPYTERWEIL